MVLVKNQLYFPENSLYMRILFSNGYSHWYYLPTGGDAFYRQRRLPWLMVTESLVLLGPFQKWKLLEAQSVLSTIKGGDFFCSGDRSGQWLQNKSKLGCLSRPFRPRVACWKVSFSYSAPRSRSWKSRLDNVAYFRSSIMRKIVAYKSKHNSV